MTDLAESEPDYSDYVEVDPTGRYGRYNDVLGRGASKMVYRAFDEYEGIEVAWNQVKLHDFLKSAKDLEGLYSEIHLLKTLKHENIMKFYTSWVDTSKRNINFITEMFTSGTLRQYRLKHKRVCTRAVKHWCRQILQGLLYLHTHDPPVIHRDLKCDNIFINGNQGEVKIGDLGLAAILSNSHAAHCVGTPEFMAPEVYGEEYNELVDIYSFGMCILEMVTFEYPYSECTSPAHIYKKVISGKRPDALNKVKDPDVRQFIEKCLATVSSRLSARELLNDPFLQTEDYGCDLRSVDARIRQSSTDPCNSDCSYLSWNCNSNEYEPYNEEGHDEEEHSPDTDITIKGTRREDGNIYLKLRIADIEDQIRNIHFPFDVEMDTALSVATELVAELDITDQDVTYIAEMIDGEISKLVPEWISGPEIDEDLCVADTNSCLNSISPSMKLVSSNIDHCSGGGSAIHGRFEEVMPKVDGSENDTVEDDELPNLTEQHNAEKWDCQESFEISSLYSGISHSDDDHKISDKPEIDGSRNEGQSSKSDDSEDDFQWELRWLKAKHQLEVRGIMDQRLKIPFKSRHKHFSASDFSSPGMVFGSDDESHEALMRGFTGVDNSSAAANKSLCASSLLPGGVLQRTTSLPVDAVHI